LQLTQRTRSEPSVDLLALEQRQLSKVAPVEPDDVERIVNGLASALHQVVKCRAAGAVKDKFAIISRQKELRKTAPMLIDIFLISLGFGYLHPQLLNMTYWR